MLSNPKYTDVNSDLATIVVSGSDSRANVSDLRAVSVMFVSDSRISAILKAEATATQAGNGHQRGRWFSNI